MNIALRVAQKYLAIIGQVYDGTCFSGTNN